MGWRLVICFLLLAWIFHAIFMNEGRIAWTGEPAWGDLTRQEQWARAWTLGPPQLWDNLTSVHPLALLVSFLVMGLTIAIGVARWLVALGAQGLSLGWSRALEISLIAHFFNSFL